MIQFCLSSQPRVGGISCTLNKGLYKTKPVSNKMKPDCIVGNSHEMRIMVLQNPCLRTDGGTYLLKSKRFHTRHIIIICIRVPSGIQT